MSKEKKSGRPRRNADEVLGQLTIRLSSKLKFGLELLARAQHRSLSQAVEWALQVGLNNYQIGSIGDGSDTIATIVDQVWSKERESDRLIKLYNLAPTLLGFEDFKTCELIERSVEWVDIRAMQMNGGAPHEIEAYREWNKRRQDEENIRSAIFYDLAHIAWPLLREKAIELAEAGKPTTDQSLVYLLDMREILARHIRGPLDSWALMQRYVRIFGAPDPTKEIKSYLAEEIAAARDQLIESHIKDGLTREEGIAKAEAFLAKVDADINAKAEQPEP